MADVELARRDSKIKAQLCAKMLWLARCMLDQVDACRIPPHITHTSSRMPDAACAARRLEARIGISAGKVVVGALGSLQPRMHIRGEAANDAERLEAAGIPGKIHVCASLLDLISLAPDGARTISEGVAAGWGRDKDNKGEGVAGAMANANGGSMRRRRSGPLTHLTRSTHGEGRRFSAATEVSAIDISFGGTWSLFRCCLCVCMQVDLCVCVCVYARIQADHDPYRQGRP